MKIRVIFVIVFSLLFLGRVLSQEQDTSSLWNQANNELDNLQENYQLALNKIELAEDILVKQAESLSQAEILSKNLGISLSFYKKQNKILLYSLAFMASVTLAESCYIFARP